MNKRAGTVYFAGGGSGPSSLASVRLMELLERADAIVYDHQVDAELLQRGAAAAERIDVDESAPEETAVILSGLVARHESVLRLLRDDPFTSERGSAEVSGVADLGLRFEVVPAAPHSLAAAVYAGIPLVFPGLASGFTSLASPLESVAGDRVGFLEQQPTIVLSTSVRNVQEDCRALMASGCGGQTPSAAILDGASPRQQVVAGTLDSIPSLVHAHASAPVVLIVGDVVELRERLAWYERRPLFGKRIVVTRARAQAGGFASDLEALGAEVVPLPTIRIVEPVDPEPLQRAAAEADRFDWIVFTSVNGVERFWRQLRAVGGDTRTLAGVSLCAIGPATAAAVELEGARADLVPEQFVAEGVVEALSSEVRLEGSRILLPRAEVARSVLPEALREQGAEVVEVDAYRTVPDGSGADQVRRGLESGEIDLITFTASSTVRNFVDLIGTGVGSAAVGCIGPITAGTARELGLPVSFEAEEYTIPGLTRAIQRFFDSQSR